MSHVAIGENREIGRGNVFIGGQDAGKDRDDEQ